MPHPATSRLQNFENNEEPTAVLLTERRGHVFLITLNRPQARNAINGELGAAMGRALDELTGDPELRVGVITGNGKAFCAGQDLRALAAGEPMIPTGHPEWGFGGFAQHQVDKPLIAAVNGPAVGGGLELALFCDLILATEDAIFGLPEVTRGLFAAAGGLQRSAQQLPEKIAKRLALTGQPMTAGEAARFGLVNDVVPCGQLLDAALELAGVIAANAPLSVTASKRLIQLTVQQGSLEPAPWELNEKEMRIIFSSEDAREGALAFAEKREPVWKGR
ncbi:crotonase/enoyl-CoA hydratase family protein [Paenarthrobacter sp. YIM B13468]|uniref:crotonase/enoyl-CoA hydratase family protein n=1 Tax=Paenarthrobacter sp. YIM B13468 TaxID=3366295 RepID=UPI0036735074